MDEYTEGIVLFTCKVSGAAANDDARLLGGQFFYKFKGNGFFLGLE